MTYLRVTRGGGSTDQHTTPSSMMNRCFCLSRCSKLMFSLSQQTDCCGQQAVRCERSGDEAVPRAVAVDDDDDDGAVLHGRRGDEAGDFRIDVEPATDAT